MAAASSHLDGGTKRGGRTRKYKQARRRQRTASRSCRRRCSCTSSACFRSNPPSARARSPPGGAPSGRAAGRRPPPWTSASAPTTPRIRSSKPWSGAGGGASSGSPSPSISARSRPSTSTAASTTPPPAPSRTCTSTARAASSGSGSRWATPTSRALPDSFSARSHSFSALEVIHLHGICISDDTVRSLVAACPLLHTADLRYCEGLNSVSVEAAGAHLRSLTVAECDPYTEFIFFADEASGLRSFRYSCAYSIPATTSLADLYICFGGPDRRRCLLGPYGCELRRNWLQLLTNLSNLTVLTLCSSALRRLPAKARARLVARNAAPCKLQNLRELQLLMFAMEIDNMNDIYSFLVACCGPRLEKLFVQLPTGSCPYEAEDEPSGSMEELSMQEPPDEDELNEDLSEGEALEKDRLEDELREADALEEDELEEELTEGNELEEELSGGEPPEEKESKKHGSMEELSDGGPSEEETLEDGDGFENLMLLNMMNFLGRDNEMQLVSLVVKKSTSLKQLILFTPKINHPEELQNDHMNTYHFLKRKLLPLRNASPNAQIVLSEPDDSAIQPLHEAFVKIY